MKTILRTLLLLSILAGTVAHASALQDVEKTRLIIGMNSVDARSDILDILKGYNGVLIKEIPAIDALVIEVPNRMSLKMKTDPGLGKYSRFIEADVKVSIPPIPVTLVSDSTIQSIPNDPEYYQQWGLSMVDAPFMWDHTTGSPDLIVAVIDTGVDYNHVDLAAVNQAIGWDFVNDDSDAMDDNGHGTHVAGIIAATRNNGIGISGVAPGVTIMPVKVLNAIGSGWMSDVAAGITFAADNGAKIISMSIGGGPSPSLSSATKYAAYEKGCLLFAASGNDGGNIVTYPAAYNWVIGVGAVGHDGNRASYSNYGNFVSLAAPGGSYDGDYTHDILSTWPGNQYSWNAGTSMATPFASGVAALYWSARPALTNVQIARVVIASADDIGTPGKDIYYGYGLVDAYPLNG